MAPGEKEKGGEITRIFLLCRHDGTIPDPHSVHLIEPSDLSSEFVFGSLCLENLCRNPKLTTDWQVLEKTN